MRIAPAILALAATGFLAACNEEVACTEEVATQKATELGTKIQELATSDPAKLAEMGPKVQELATKAAAGGDDLQATWTALDEMMAELSK
jgi:outer membrane murein-binding lipoprotein Lpp